MRRKAISAVVLLLTLLVMLAAPALAANDPGHDNLYVLKLGDSNVTGNINLSGQLTAQLVRVSNKFFGDYLDIVANGTVVNPSSSPAIQAATGSLYLDSTGNLYLNTKAGTTGIVQVGDPSTNGITLNVSGTILQQGVGVCLANGTNCAAGNNTGNISSVAAGNGISVSNPDGPTATVSINAPTCISGEYSYWDGSAWQCGSTVAGGGNLTGGGVADYVARWVNGSSLGPGSIWDNTTQVNITADLRLGNGTAAGQMYASGGDLVINTSGSLNLSATAVNVLGNLTMGNYSITGLATPVDGSDAATKAYVDSAAGGAIVEIASYTAAGNYTWTKPAGVSHVMIEMVGGGGSGSGGYSSSYSSSYIFGAGGGAGGYCKKYLDVSAIANLSITVGAGGAHVANTTTGNNGSSTSVNGTYFANGGGGALGVGTYPVGGSGGNASGCDLNLDGSDGFSAIGTTSTYYFGGSGGASFFGGAGKGGSTTTAAYKPGSSGTSGSGGGGAYYGYYSGAGGDGLVVLTEYK